MRTIIYTRVSSETQGESGLGLEAQRGALEAEANKRGWGPASLVVEVASGKNIKNRPQLLAALNDLDAGRAEVLMVTKVDRVGRSLLDVLRLAERATKNGWHLVVLECQVDTSTPQGRFVLQALAAVAELERGLISQRTKDALKAKKAQGARLGAPIKLPAEVRQQIVALRAAGVSLAKIAATLEAAGVPTARGGGRWYASTIAKVLLVRWLTKRGSRTLIAAAILSWLLSMLRLVG